MNLYLYLTLYIKVNSIHTIDLHVKAKTMTHIEENIGKSLSLGFDIKKKILKVL